MKNSMKIAITGQNDKESTFKIKKFNNDDIFNDTSFS